MYYPISELQCPQCPTIKGKPVIGTPYVQFYASDAISEANAKNKFLPKYGFHLSVVCPQCGSFIKHLKQNDELIGQKFILIPQD